MNCFYHALLFVTVVLVGAVTNALAQEATFEGLGTLDDEEFYSAALGVSADGHVIVGNGGYWFEKPFRWEDGVVVELEGLSEGYSEFLDAWSVSGDGSVIVGTVLTDDRSEEPYRWENSEMIGLGHLPGGHKSYAEDVSSDGSVVVGSTERALGAEAFRWENGSMIGLGNLGGQDSLSNARGVSADGFVIVGRSRTEEGDEAFRWENGEMVGLGRLLGSDCEFSFGSSAYDVSPDGSVVVGWSCSDIGPQAFRWRDDTMEGLGILSGKNSSRAYAVSGDGSAVVGGSWSEDDSAAFFWTEESEMRSLKEVLENDLGLDLEGWTLRAAWDISDDGLVVVGSGINPDGNFEAWRAFLGIPIADENGPDGAGALALSVGPNPSSGIVELELELAEPGETHVAVFDLRGREVALLQNGPLSAGTHAFTWESGGAAAGVYVIRAEAGEAQVSTHVTITR